MTRLVNLYFLLAILALVTPCSVKGTQHLDKWRLNEIQTVENGYMEKTAGDPFIIFPEIQKATCSSMGVQLSVSFDPVPKKPVLLEIFWSTDYLGFGEENKVFFIVHPNKNGTPNRFVVPLNHTAGFRQIRLDFPAYINSRFKINEYDVISLSSIPEELEIIDAYYNLSVKESLKPEVIIPYIVKAFSHGPKRMLKDKPFLFFWLFLLVALLFLIRKSAKN